MIEFMTILWLCNNPTPQASMAFGLKTVALGGWMVWLSEQLGKEQKIKLCLAFPNKDMKKISKCEVNNIEYYAVPNLAKRNWIYNTEYEKEFSRLLDVVKPDIVHIWGTEYQHSLALLNACEMVGLLNRCIISVQGLVGIYAKYYYGNLDNAERHMLSLRDIIKHDTLKIQQKHFFDRGTYEAEALKKVKNVIGRTDWDLACTTMINPKLKYYSNNENLRNNFYEEEWSYEKCNKYQIFISQAQYPIKGLDVLLKALPNILASFPDTRVYVAGAPIIMGSKIKKTTYEKIISGLIEQYNLENVVYFVGMCNEQQMVEQYLKANVFVCPSSIENSPNSVGEAMLLGTPVVASNVGGTNCLLTHNEEGFLYQSDADYMLAFYVKKLFSNPELSIKLSSAARSRASLTHDREKNYKELLNIYDEIIKDG